MRFVCRCVRKLYVSGTRDRRDGSRRLRTLFATRPSGDSEIDPLMSSLWQRVRAATECSPLALLHRRMRASVLVDATGRITGFAPTRTVATTRPLRRRNGARAILAIGANIEPRIQRIASATAVCSGCQQAARHRCAAGDARRVVAASFDIRQRLFRIKGRWRQPRAERERIHLPPERVKVVGDTRSRKYGQQFDCPGRQAPPYCQIRATRQHSSLAFELPERGLRPVSTGPVGSEHLGHALALLHPHTGHVMALCSPDAGFRADLTRAHCLRPVVLKCWRIPLRGVEVAREVGKVLRIQQIVAERAIVQLQQISNCSGFNGPVTDIGAGEDISGVLRGCRAELPEPSDGGSSGGGRAFGPRIAIFGARPPIQTRVLLGQHRP